jgi:hypothetical protein
MISLPPRTCVLKSSGALGLKGYDRVTVPEEVSDRTEGRQKRRRRKVGERRVHGSTSARGRTFLPAPFHLSLSFLCRVREDGNETLKFAATALNQNKSMVA